MRARSSFAVATVALVLAAGCSTVLRAIPEQLLYSTKKIPGVSRIAVLPLAYRGEDDRFPCDLCPDRVILDVTSADQALLVTAFFYEALTQHPSIHVVPHESVEAARGATMRETLERLLAREQIDAVLVGALLELRPRIGDPQDPRQRAGAALYAALLDVDTGKPLWRRVYDRSPEPPSRLLRQYLLVVEGEDPSTLTAEEVAQLGVQRMVESLARALR